MTILELGDALHRPVVLRKILGEYKGPFSLGVLSPGRERKWPVILLRVTERGHLSFPDQVEIEGESFPVSIEEGYARPVAAH
jgi:hypothetical protein